MKKVMNYQFFGYPVAPILIAAFWMLIASWMWSGSLFNGINFPSLPSWQELNGLTEADLDVMPISWQLVGILAILIQTVGLAILLKWRKVSTIAMAVQTGLIASMAFSVPIVMYPMVYHPDHNIMLFLINAGNYMFGLVTTAILLTVLPGIKQEQLSMDS
ncbi:MAG: hypothetical protein AAF629_10870 [Chloroflexota bacterium]